MRTGAPADCSRLSGSGSRAGTRCAPSPGEDAAAPGEPAGAVVAVAGAPAPASSAAVSSGSTTSTSSAPPAGRPTSCWDTQSANWPISLLPTSTITPRPNCAGRPVIDSVVTRSTAVRAADTGVAVAVTIMAAVDEDRAAFPVASIRARCATGSFSTIVALPW